MENIEIISVNYNTPDLIIRMIKSVRKHISERIAIHIIDGSSMPIDELLKLEKQDKYLKITKFDYNIHHGRGMHYGIINSKAKYVLILDSDSVVIKNGALDYLFGLMLDDVYGVGQIINIDCHGVNSVDGIPYLHPKFMLISVYEYKKYNQFINHGAPCIKAMFDIYNNGLTTKLINAKDANDYFHEDGRGTVSRFGYGFGGSNLKKARINILVRTSGRPNYFSRCYGSIMGQKYDNINLIVSCDDDQTYEYVSKYNIANIVRVTPQKEGLQRRFFDEIGRWRNPAHWNLYFNEMYKYIDKGFVMFLDDDDLFTDRASLTTIANEFSRNTGSMFWRVLFPNNRIIPTDSTWINRKPKCCNISGIGFGFNSEYIRYAKWDGYDLSDYVVAKRLYEFTPNKKYIDKVLTKVGRSIANGLGRRDDI